MHNVPPLVEGLCGWGGGRLLVQLNGSQRQAAAATEAVGGGPVASAGPLVFTTANKVPD